MKNENEKIIKISVVVPVYGVEKYIKKCMLSLIEQTLKNDLYEILVINDGTKDNSINIIKENFLDIKNIKVINQLNKGLSAARNTGIKAAKGKYIVFIDSDDYIEKKMLKKMLENIKTGSDLVVTGFNWVYEKKNIEDERFLSDQKIKSKNKIFKKLFLNEINTSIWNKMFKIEILKKQNIYFDDLKGAEDYDFIFRYLLYTEEIKVIGAPYYNYIQRQSGLSKDKSINFYKNNLEMLKKIIFLYEKNKWIENKKEFIYFISHNYIYILRALKKVNGVKNKEIKELWKYLKCYEILRNEYLGKKIKIRFLKLKLYYLFK